MTNKPLSSIGILLITSFTVALPHVTAVYENSTLTLACVVFGDALYRVDLTFLPNRKHMNGNGALSMAEFNTQRASKPMTSNIGIIWSATALTPAKFMVPLFMFTLSISSASAAALVAPMNATMARSLSSNCP